VTALGALGEAGAGAMVGRSAAKSRAVGKSATPRLDLIGLTAQARLGRMAVNNQPPKNSEYVTSSCHCSLFITTF
jgi:hypothetical protein